MGNRPEFLEAAWGAQRSGLYWTPVNWHLTAEEASYVVADCGARALFAAAETAELAAAVVRHCPEVESAFTVGGVRDGLADYARALDGVSVEPAPEEVEGSYFFYSAGTTGRPKGIKPGALVLHPAVADVAVVGVPDAELGQSVLAVVQPAPGEAAGPELAEALIAHCRASLAGFKCPRAVEFVPELPRLPTGKLLRRRLREQYEGTVPGPGTSRETPRW